MNPNEAFWRSIRLVLMCLGSGSPILGFFSQPMHFAGEGDGAISSNYQLLSIFDDHKAAGIRYANTSQKGSEPRYIRIEQVGNLQSGMFYEGHKSALLLNSLDVDVSSDGHSWLHAFGPICTRSLRHY